MAIVIAASDTQILRVSRFIQQNSHGNANGEGQTIDFHMGVSALFMVVEVALTSARCGRSAPVVKIHRLISTIKHRFR